MGNKEQLPSTFSKSLVHPSVNNDEAIAPLIDNQSISDPEEHTYEPLSAKLKVTCPTCQGKGKLSQGQADSMVALIPVRDKRLRPRKTKLYFCITIIVAIVCIFLSAFFFLPRNVSIKIIDIKALTINMSTKKEVIPFIDVAITFEVQNDNFFEADISELTTDISWNKFILQTNMTVESFSVRARQKFNRTFVSRQLFSGSDVKSSVLSICATSWSWSLFEKFVTTAKILYLARSELVSDTYYGYTDCHNSTSISIA